MQIDHLIYTAPDLTAAIEDLEQRLGVRADPGGSHPGLGTRNALLALGPQTYLEIIAPDPGQPEPARPRPFGIGQRTRGALASWAITCDDIDQAVADARARGYDPGPVTDGQRAAPAGTLRWRATPPADGLLPFLIAWGGTTHPSQSAPRGLTLESLRIEHPDPSSLAPALSALGIDLTITQATTPALIATLTTPAGPITLR